MKKRKVLAVLLCAAMTAALAVGCGGSKGSDSSDKSSDSSSSSDDVITVGFSQVGAESDWRTANSQSMKDTFSKENGYDLIFDDAQQKQENQITAIRNFIQQEVDYILLAPVTETGWDTVLQEAKDADIPVIIVDRAEELIKKLEAGEDVEKLNYVDEEIFAKDDTVKSVKATNSLDEEKDFDVTPLTQDILDGRAY